MCYIKGYSGVIEGLDGIIKGHGDVIKDLAVAGSI